jgi:ubiquinol-cytochrome c reductase cytochrome c subunit
MKRLLSITIAAAALVPAAAAPAAGPGSLVTKGHALFGQYCVACHGLAGSGIPAPSSGKIGAGPQRLQTQQRVVAPSLRGVGAVAADFYLRTGYMPLRDPHQQPSRSPVLFPEQDIRAMVAYVASLGGGPGIPHPQPQQGSVAVGQKLFVGHCAGCHQIVGEGGYVTGARVPPLEEATARQIAQAVRIGPYLMPRFSKRQLTDAQLNSLIAYIDYAKHPDDVGGWSLGHLGPWPEGLVTWLIAAAALVALCIVLGKRLPSP